MLTTKQKAFVAAYRGNAAEAARIAGYAPKWADRQAHTLMEKNGEIAAAIKEREQERVDAMIATREERQSFWTSVMRDEKTELKDRLRASELLAKSEADFMERFSNETPMPPTIDIHFVRADTALEG